MAVWLSFDFHIASFFKFIHANLSLTHIVTWAKPRAFYILAEINIHRITSIIIWRYRLIKSYRKVRCNSITYSLKTFRQTVEKTVATRLASGWRSGKLKPTNGNPSKPFKKMHIAYNAYLSWFRAICIKIRRVGKPIFLVEVTGLEPAASCSQSKHSSQTELHLEILSFGGFGRAPKANTSSNHSPWLKHFACKTLLIITNVSPLPKKSLDFVGSPV